MDLSKIPEPTADEAEGVASWIDDYAFCGEDWIVPREVKVIAHLLRHGRVLAKSLKELVYSATTPEEQAAISFFEKFGGNDER